ncbi:MAG TPA: hypothetical protein VLM38_15900, partial [Blastocatellia bacterium]|nr:hypothetical protein [Blastocatellia bacterium]
MRHWSGVCAKVSNAMSIVVLPLLIVLLITCGQKSQSEAELRLRHYFDLPRAASFQSKPSLLLTKLPIGTPEEEIYDFLDKSGVGNDGLSSYYRAGERDEIICRVEYHVKAGGLVKESFGVFLQLDNDRRLKSAKIERWL